MVQADKGKKQKIPVQTITGADYADDIAHWQRYRLKPKSCLERAPAGIGFHVNTDKMEYMCFNQTGDLSTLNGSSMKLVDKCTYLVSSVSSTKTDINT